MRVYASLCGWTLAQAHACSGDRIALAAYLGGSDLFDQAIAEFAETYAEQSERDYTVLEEAVTNGRVESTTEIQTPHARRFGPGGGPRVSGRGQGRGCRPYCRCGRRVGREARRARPTGPPGGAQPARRKRGDLGQDDVAVADRKSTRPEAAGNGPRTVVTLPGPGHRGRRRSVRRPRSG